MEINLNETIKETKKLLYTTNNNDTFNKYSSCYLWTTESIKDYLLKTNFNKNRALTVLGSGDQVFNLAYFNVLNIDTFDVNLLQYFIYELKKAAIINLTYQEFINSANNAFYFDDFDLFNQFLDKIKLNLPIIVYEYFKKMIKYITHNKRSYNFLRGNRAIVKHNLYYDNINNYELTKRNLNNISVNFYLENVKNISNILKNKYDIIILSNIYDYINSYIEIDYNKERNIFNLKELNDYLLPFYNILDKDGILINYFLNSAYKLLINSNFETEDINLDNLYKTDNGSYYLIRKKN